MPTRHFFALLALFAIPATTLAQDYVIITGESVNIRTAPGGTIVGQAASGDVFRFYVRGAGWFGIFMFSGEDRYVHASLARLTDSVPAQPDEATRRRVFQALVRAEDRATAEADRRIAPTTLATIYRNIDLQRVLDDRYKLEVCHRFGIQPAHYNSLKLEGVRKGWFQ